MVSKKILKSAIFLGVLILLLSNWIQFYAVLAATAGPAPTQKYDITNSPIAKHLLPSPLNATIQASGGENTTNTEQVSIQKNTTYTEKAQGQSLKANTRSLEKFELLMEEARKQHMKTIAELKRINTEMISQQEKSYQIYANKTQIAQLWSYKINQLVSLKENQTKQQVTADLNEVKNLHYNVIPHIETVLNKTSGYAWEENHDKKWVNLLDRAEQIKKTIEDMEKRFEDKVSKLHFVSYQ